MTALLPPPAAPAEAPPLAPPVAAPARQTSVPVWPAAAPPLDRTGRCFLVVQIGPAAADVARGWAAEAHDAGHPCSLWSVPDAGRQTQEALARRLDALHVGARLAVAGPEADVLAVAAAARRTGLVPEEITTHVVDRGERHVFCVHCEATSRLAAAPGDEVTCPGCRRRLEVHEHVSGHRGSYLASAVATPAGPA